MPPLYRSLAACAFAALPSLALAQAAPLKPDGALRYAVGVGGSYLAGTMVTAATANIGGEGAVGDQDTRWRFGGKALWSRTGSETMTESVTVLLSEESQHRWRGSTWFRQKLSLFPALRAGDGVRGTLDAGVAAALGPLCSVHLGLTQRYDSNVGLKASDTQFVTGIAMKLR